MMILFSTITSERKMKFLPQRVYLNPNENYVSDPL